ncbi:hypothetical protein TNCV_5089881 [Trichonephila clavipes]|nr:hypothetical protein TNCV_5089881 [Trichonephila clavipes]
MLSHANISFTVSCARLHGWRREKPHRDGLTGSRLGLSQVSLLASRLNRNTFKEFSLYQSHLNELLQKIPRESFSPVPNISDTHITSPNALQQHNI